MNVLYNLKQHSWKFAKKASKKRGFFSISTYPQLNKEISIDLTSNMKKITCIKANSIKIIHTNVKGICFFTQKVFSGKTQPDAGHQKTLFASIWEKTQVLPVCHTPRHIVWPEHLALCRSQLFHCWNVLRCGRNMSPTFMSPWHFAKMGLMYIYIVIFLILSYYKLDSICRCIWFKTFEFAFAYFSPDCNVFESLLLHLNPIQFGRNPGEFRFESYLWMWRCWSKNTSLRIHFPSQIQTLMWNERMHIYIYIYIPINNWIHPLKLS